MRNKFGISAALVAIGLTIFYFGQQGITQPDRLDQGLAGPMVTVQPAKNLSENAQIGQMAFEAKCAVCHGESAAGQNGIAPPLVHKIYEPSHHGDEAFQRAAALGVKRHHWEFGDMPPVEGLTRGDVTMILAYIRELQRANGIN